MLQIMPLTVKRESLKCGDIGQRDKFGRYVESLAARFTTGGEG
jgi:hypothetical protein